MKKLFLITLLLLLSTTLVGATNYCEDANNVGCFLMEDSGNETDRGGNTSNTLTETSGTIPQDADAKFGDYSRDFEASETEYLAHADSLETDIFGADATFTIVAWVKLEAGSSSDQYIVTKLDLSGQAQYGIYIDGNEIPVLRLSNSVSDGDDEKINSDQGALDTGTWYHIAGVYDDTDKIIYRNGVATSASKTDGIFDGNQEFKIGSRDGARYWDGLIDEVAVFDRALSSGEITDIMNNGLLQDSVGPLNSALYDATIYNATLN